MVLTSAMSYFRAHFLMKLVRFPWPCLVVCIALHLHYGTLFCNSSASCFVFFGHMLPCIIFGHPWVVAPDAIVKFISCSTLLVALICWLSPPESHWFPSRHVISLLVVLHLTLENMYKYSVSLQSCLWCALRSSVHVRLDTVLLLIEEVWEYFKVYLIASESFRNTNYLV